MERIQALIDKLYTQKQESASPAQLLFTVQLLQSELMHLQGSKTLGTAKVAVTLPAKHAFSHPVPAPVAEVPAPVTVAEVAQPVAAPVKPEPPQYEAYMPKPAVPQPEVPAFTAVPARDTAEEARNSYSLRKPQVVEVEPARPARPAVNPAFEVAEELPVLVQHAEPREVYELAPEPREVNELVAGKGISLNDRLKQEKTELAHALKQTPIKDLRKGIGINDRFAFVNELFRGDEAMYERSIKTINSFNIYSEAEYWINRELKFKLGWVDNKETVQHFYQLVSRRFS